MNNHAARSAAKHVTARVGMPDLYDRMNFVPEHNRCHFTVRASYDQVARALPEVASMVEPYAAMWELANRLHDAARGTGAVAAECSVVDNGPEDRRVAVRFTVYGRF